MEQRLIDANALNKAICSNCALFLDKTCDGNRISCYPSSIVREQPTIDAVSVDFINQKIVELQSCAIQYFDDGQEILATCVWETIRLLGSFLKEWRGKEKAMEKLKRKDDRKASNIRIEHEDERGDAE